MSECWRGDSPTGPRPGSPLDAPRTPPPPPRPALKQLPDDGAARVQQARATVPAVVFATLSIALPAVVLAGLAVAVAAVAYSVERVAITALAVLWPRAPFDAAPYAALATAAAPASAVGGLNLAATTPTALGVVPLPVAFSTFVATVLGGWALAEAAFVVYFLRRRRQLQRHLPLRQLPPAERDLLFRRCMAAITDMEAFLVGWFRGAAPGDIWRGNVEQWLAWAFFQRRWAELSPDEVKEVAERIATMEARLGRRFAPGYNRRIRSMRVTLDPLAIYYKPLGYYVFLRLLNEGYGCVLRCQGFRRYVAGQHAYWYWPGRAGPDALPLLFLHGIGVGLAPYASFVNDLRAQGHPVFLVELPHISSQFVEAVPSMDATVADIETLLRRHGFRHALFVGHSMGTGAASDILGSLAHSGRGVGSSGGRCTPYRRGACPQCTRRG